jgi:alpha/beta superfamily hydrolase
MAAVTLRGPGGRLEGRYHAHTSAAKAPVALVLHPHPQHGGTMNNKVAYRVHQTLFSAGFHTLSINFRGVGHSEGAYDHGVGELQDAAAALQWLKEQHPEAMSCWIAGFSFGAWIALQLVACQVVPTRFIAVSPPASMYSFDFLAQVPLKGVIIQGTEDEIVVPQSVVNLANTLKQQGAAVTYHEINKACHFFKEHMNELEHWIRDYVFTELPELTQVLVQSSSNTDIT